MLLKRHTLEAYPFGDRPLPNLLTPETILIGGCFYSATCDLWLVRLKYRLCPGFTPQLTGPEV